jgi:hypothetical protein
MALLVASAVAAQTSDDDAVPTEPQSERKCETSVRTVRKEICESGRQRVKICTGGGKRQTLEVLGCV